VDDYFSRTIDHQARSYMPAVPFHLDEQASARAKGVASQFIIYFTQDLRLRMILDKNQVLAEVASFAEPDTWLDLACLSAVEESHDGNPKWDYSLTHSPRLEEQVRLVLQHLEQMYPFLVNALDPTKFPETRNEYSAVLRTQDRPWAKNPPR
jgi:hypothetical protein